MDIYYTNDNGEHKDIYYALEVDDQEQKNRVQAEATVKSNSGGEELYYTSMNGEKKSALVWTHTISSLELWTVLGIKEQAYTSSWS